MLTLLFASAQLHVAPFLQMQPVLIIYPPVSIKKNSSKTQNTETSNIFLKLTTTAHDLPQPAALRIGASDAGCSYGISIQAWLQ